MSSRVTPTPSPNSNIELGKKQLIHEHNVPKSSRLSPKSSRLGSYGSIQGIGNDELSDGASAKAGTNISRSKLILLISSWYFTSIFAAKLNYVAMDQLGSPILLSLFHQTFVCVSGGLSMVLDVRTFSRKAHSISFFQKIEIVLPLGLTMALLSSSYNLAMMFIPVSFLNTIKSTIPLWTCLICWLVQGQHFSILTKLSLLPIVIGVSLASLNEVGFSTIGFFLACFSAFNQTLFNIRAKRILKRGRICKTEMQLLTALVSASLLFILVALVYLIGANDIDVEEMEANKNSGVFSLGAYGVLAVCGINYYIEIRLCYNVLASLGSLAYSIVDVLRRLCVIVSAVLLFQNPIALLNILGVCIALMGILLYNMSTSIKDLTFPSWVLKRRTKSTASLHPTTSSSYQI